MNKNDLDVLDEVNKGATMGMDAIEFVEKKLEMISLGKH